MEPNYLLHVNWKLGSEKNKSWLNLDIKQDNYNPLFENLESYQTTRFIWLFIVRACGPYNSKTGDTDFIQISWSQYSMSQAFGIYNKHPFYDKGTRAYAYLRTFSSRTFTKRKHAKVETTSVRFTFYSVKWHLLFF